MPDSGVLLSHIRSGGVQGLATTFHLLTKTENEAALRVLLAALDSPARPSRKGR